MVEYRVVRLWADRVRMVKRCLEHPGTWPDGIDSSYGRWYLGHEDYWREKVGHLTAEGAGLAGLMTRGRLLAGVMAGLGVRRAGVRGWLRGSLGLRLG